MDESLHHCKKAKETPPNHHLAHRDTAKVHLKDTRIILSEHLNSGKKKERPCRSFRISEGFVSLAYCYDCSENLHIPLHGCREQVCHCVHMQLIYSFLLRSTRRNSYVFLTLNSTGCKMHNGSTRASLIGVFGVIFG